MFPSYETPYATITVTTQGAMIVDAGSETGTCVNDQQIPTRGLVDNDIIRNGGTRLTFKSII
jgi:pSer/pThr/pTyr-binding forkhead associated (FHA) protein